VALVLPTDITRTARSAITDMSGDSAGPRGGPTPIDAPAGNVTRDILGYLLRHPDMADSLEGLARWRLAEMTVRHTLDETERAVNWLVDRGWVREVARPHWAALFTLDEARRDEAASFLGR
jgi:hypothetical protein